MSELNMHELARKGAVAELQRLEHESAAIRRAFPNLNGNTAPQELTGRRWHMSPKARKAQSIKMKIYWANRRANKKRQAAA